MALFQKADIAAASLYITDYRSAVVDFTDPFMRVQATLLLRKPPKGMQLRIKSAKDLINQSEIKYGTLKKGVIRKAFRTTNDTAYKILWRNMQRFDDSVFTDTNEQGIDRVRRDKYAYVLPSTIGEYITLRYPCDLVTVDRFLMSRGYALAVQHDSPLKQRLDRGIKGLQKSGYLTRLYRRWWTSGSECNGIKTGHLHSPAGAPTWSFSTLSLMWVSFALRFFFLYHMLLPIEGTLR